MPRKHSGQAWEEPNPITVTVTVTWWPRSPRLGQPAGPARSAKPPMGLVAIGRGHTVGPRPLLGDEEERKPNLTTADTALGFKVLPESPPGDNEGFNPTPLGLEDPSESRCPGFLTPRSREAPLPTHIFQRPKSSIAQSSAWGTIQEHARDTNTAQDVSVNPKAPPHGRLAAPTAPTPRPPPSRAPKMSEHRRWWGWLGAAWR